MLSFSSSHYSRIALKTGQVYSSLSTHFGFELSHNPYKKSNLYDQSCIPTKSFSKFYRSGMPDLHFKFPLTPNPLPKREGNLKKSLLRGIFIQCFLFFRLQQDGCAPVGFVTHTFCSDKRMITQFKMDQATLIGRHCF